MTEMLLFHHAQGLTDGVKAFAQQLREAGHTVHAPDLYEGNTFDSLEEGIGYARKTGFGTVAQRGIAAAEQLPPLVYAGFSLGVMPAQQLAQTRAGAKGALFVDACLPVSEFGGWPSRVPVQIHGMDQDEFFAEEGGDIDAARELVTKVDNAELFLYPGDKHLFADNSLPGYDAEAARLLLERVNSFLEPLG